MIDASLTLFPGSTAGTGAPATRGTSLDGGFASVLAALLGAGAAAPTPSEPAANEAVVEGAASAATGDDQAVGKDGAGTAAAPTAAGPAATSALALAGAATGQPTPTGAALKSQADGANATAPETTATDQQSQATGVPPAADGRPATGLAALAVRATSEAGKPAPAPTAPPAGGTPATPAAGPGGAPQTTAAPAPAPTVAMGPSDVLGMSSRPGGEAAGRPAVATATGPVPADAAGETSAQNDGEMGTGEGDGHRRTAASTGSHRPIAAEAAAEPVPGAAASAGDGGTPPGHLAAAPAPAAGHGVPDPTGHGLFGHDRAGADGAHAPVRDQVMGPLLAHDPAPRGNERLVLHLQPAALGKVEVQLQVQDNRLQIVFRAESAAAEQALRESADELVQAVLHRGEARWHTVDVRVDRPDGQRSQDGETDEGEPRERSQGEDGPGGDGQRRDRQHDRRREDGATA